MVQFVYTTEMTDPAVDWNRILCEINKKLPIIFYTKAQVPLSILTLPLKNFAVSYTVTGWGGTSLEPKVPLPEDMIKHINGSGSMLGNRLSLRVDPVVPTYEGYKRALDVIGKIQHPTRIITSVLQLYSGHDVIAKKLGIDMSMYSVTSGRARYVNKQSAQNWIDTVTKKYPWTVGRLQMCGMPYKLEGVIHTGCVDNAMLKSIGITEYQHIPEGKQRPGCKCVISKKQLIMGLCVHGCAYCYAHKENLKNVF